VIPQKVFIPLIYELEKESAKTHRWMQISKSKWVAYIGHREEKKKEIGKEISGLRDKEEIMRDQLERENA